MRNSFPNNKKGSAYHAYMNRGKKSVCIDRTSEAGQQLIMELIKTADVVCESFVAGEMETWGLGYEKAKAVNPGIIYASHTGFGKTGPFSNTAGNDITAEALCGLMQITGFPEQVPTCLLYTSISSDDDQSDMERSKALLNVADILDFAETADYSDIEELLRDQAELNMAVAEEGICLLYTSQWSACQGGYHTQYR